MIYRDAGAMAGQGGGQERKGCWDKKLRGLVVLPQVIFCVQAIQIGLKCNKSFSTRINNVFLRQILAMSPHARISKGIIMAKHHIKRCHSQ